ncbi:AraC family transcriptional regulator [Methylobacterium durans]|nr:AraC family transcriptional regulator [Methylobacterium durans]
MAPHPCFATHAAIVPDGLHPPAWRIGIGATDPLHDASGSIQAALAQEAASLLRHLGADPDPVIRAAGLDPVMLTDPNAIIPLAAFCELIARSGACTGCPHFGLLLGRRVRLSSLGLIGSLMLQSETVGDALRSLIRHVEMHCVGATTALTAKDGTAVWNCVVYEPGTECADQIADAAAAAGTNVLRGLCGADWSPEEVLLPRAVPTDELTYRAVFKAPVRFNRETAALVFPASQLDQPIPGADPALLQTLRERLAEQSRRSSPDFTARLRHLLRTELMHGDCSAERIAGLLSMHRRTLARRLRAEGTAFSVVADEGRFEVARQLIDHTDIPLAQIAAALGFSEASAFTRAFRRWSGESPSAWRAGHRR